MRAFHEKFVGKNPNKPQRNDCIILNGKRHRIIRYVEFPSSGYSENEFHEIEQDWFAHVFVECI